MANPNFPVDGQGERIDALVGAGNISLLKLGIGSKSIGGTDNAAWHGAASHVDGATFVASDGVMLGAGFISGGTTVKRILIDANGNQQVVGSVAPGAAVAGNPVPMGGSDGTNIQRVAVDTGGRLQVVDGRVTDGAGVYVTLRNPNFFRSVQTAATGDTAIWTPNTGKKFRLMRFLIMLTADAATSGGAVITIKLRDATTDLNVTADFYCPTTSVTTAPGAFTTGWIDLGNGILSSTANAVLNANLSAALSSGKVRVTVAGTEE